MTSFPTDAAVVVVKRKQTLLPVLIVLFLVSYGLMAALVVEQGRTIDNQRSLILDLFGDSSKLTALEGKLVQEKNRAAAGKTKSGAHGQAQVPPAANSQAPKAQASEQADAAKGKTQSMGDAGKSRKITPQRPPKVESDILDYRRSTLSI